MTLRLDLASRAVFAEGHEFRTTGQYEILSGRVYFAVDPHAAENRGVTDIAHAPRTAAGLVRFSADFCLLKPTDTRRGNRRLLFDYGNRGNKRALQFFNDAPASNRPTTLDHAGNGFLMEHGFTVAWLGWQGDLLPGRDRLTLSAPVASYAEGPITGTNRVEFVATQPGTTVFTLGSQVGTAGYPTVSMDTGMARLTRRRYADSRRFDVPAEAWAFARVEQAINIDNESDTAVIPSDSHIYLPSGFETGWIYELIYQAKHPMVLGLGHVAVRDFVSFLRYSATPDNPLNTDEAPIEKSYAWGRSQTGRCIRDFVYLGYNDDGAGRRVFDGVMPHVAGAGKAWLNQRFANAMVLAGTDHDYHHTVVDRFPFSYACSTDHFTGRADAILRRPQTDPLVIHTDTASEYWNRRGSLVVTDTQGNDLLQPDTVRMYFWASSQHFSPVHPSPPSRGAALYFENVVSTSMFFRANLLLLDRWASSGAPPPPSRYPTRAAGTLVPYDAWRQQFPAIPGVAVPRRPSQIHRLDFGPDIDTGILSEHPPRPIADEAYPIFVPAVDADGLDRDGLRAPMVQAPLGTYLGWNLRQPEYGAGVMQAVKGSYIPFPQSQEEAAQTDDPRTPIEDRYPNAAAYQHAIQAAAERLVAEGFMLQEDVARAVKRAANWGHPSHNVSLPQADPARSRRRLP